MEPAPLKARPAPPAATPERKPSPPPPTPEAAAAPRLPAYAQARLAISQPQDAAEQQADRIAAQVSRPASAEEPTEPVPTPTPRPVPPAPADATDPTEQRIASRRGTGQPLPEAVRADMASRFGHDFMAVRVHTDEAAAALCRDVQAHAFTVGADIFFAAGAFAPETRQGKELLAHELTHVVQNLTANETTLRRVAATSSPPQTPDQKAQSAGATLTGTLLSHPTIGSIDRNAHVITLRQLSLPAFKKPFTTAPFDIPPGRIRENTQTNEWVTSAQAGRRHMASRLREKIATAPALTQGGIPIFFLKLKREEQFVSGTEEQILDQLIRPLWNAQGQHRSYDVDHKKEFQLGGDENISNYWLLESSANRSSGARINQELDGKIEAVLELGRRVWPAQSVRHSPQNARGGDTIRVEHLGGNLGIEGHPEDHWELSQITQGVQLNGLDVLSEAGIRHRNLRGSPRRIAIYSNEIGGRPAFIEWGENIEQVQLGRDPGWGFTGRDSQASIRITSVTYRQLGNGDPSGTVTGFAYSQNKYLQGMPFTWEIVKMNGVNYGGAIRQSGEGGVQSWVRQRMRAKGFSPVEIEEGHLEAGVGLVAQGHIVSDLPLLRDVHLALSIRGADVEMSATLPIDAIRLPPPFTITHTNLRVFAGTQGFSAEGSTGFEVANLGSGVFNAGVSSELGFHASGSFSFDTQLFDQADIQVRYQAGEFSGDGTLAITTPGKIRGIQSATIRAYLEHGQFSATGTVEPDLPGVEQAGLSVSHSEETGLVIGGTLTLAANPAIRSGSIEVTVTKRDDDWKVAASGTAQPAIPGIDSELHVEVDDGAFTAEASGNFRRGMLSGTARLGATNRMIGADGLPGETAEPGSPLVVYGEGSATLQLSPWLQGTAGLRFDPNGEVTVSGEIGLPGAVDLFARQEIDRSLFHVSTDIPIVPGIVAEVGGGISAQAGIGPGRLEEMRIGIEYNPAHEEDTRIIGDARLNVPADAGLRLSARAGVGLGIPGASATGGLELGGTLGVVGAAEASVHIDWTPATGLQIDAEGYLHAEPRFRLDVSGYVNVEAAFWTIYEERWALAAVEIGSNLRVGVRFPIHYREGEPLRVSTDDVVFEVPDVDPAELAEQAVDALA